MLKMIKIARGESIQRRTAQKFEIGHFMMIHANQTHVDMAQNC